MTALSQGNFFEQLLYNTVNDLYTPIQFLIGRSVGSSRGTMINLNGTSKTTEQGVLGFANSASLAYAYALKGVTTGVNVAKEGVTSSLRPVGSILESVDDVMVNPSLLQGKSYAYVYNMLSKSKGWVNSVMRKTRSADKGWVLRQVNKNGQETGKLIQYHPGSRRHFGGKPYWKISNGKETFRYPIN